MQAYDVLSDANKRLAYDKELRVRAYLEEMQFQADSAGSSSNGSDELEYVSNPTKMPVRQQKNSACH